jgi:hypothetical protein
MPRASKPNSELLALYEAALRRSKKNKKDKGGGSKKYGRNERKCARYRARVGKPNGPGASGQHQH